MEFRAAMKKVGVKVLDANLRDAVEGVQTLPSKIDELRVRRAIKVLQKKAGDQIAE